MLMRTGPFSSRTMMATIMNLYLKQVRENHMQSFKGILSPKTILKCIIQLWTLIITMSYVFLTTMQKKNEKTFLGNSVYLKSGYMKRKEVSKLEKKFHNHF